MHRLRELESAAAAQATVLPPEEMEARWAGVRQSHREMHERIRDGRKPIRIIGLAGRAGSGKSTVAGMIPGAAVLQLADPLYAALAAMLGVPENLVRQRDFKERALPWLGKSPRQLLQTLGTEWGRDSVRDDIWIQLLGRRIEGLAREGVAVAVVADVRFENESTRLRLWGGEVWHVVRPSAPGCAAHSSEAGVPVAAGDPVLINGGTLDELAAAVSEHFSFKPA